MEPTSGVWIYRVLMPDGSGWRDLVCVLPPDTGFEAGLPGEAIVGTLLEPAGHLLGPEDDASDVSPENFAENPAFCDLYHEIVQRHAPDEPGMDDEARRMGNGYVYVIDSRTPDPGGEVPPEDIVGRFEVREGRVVREAYSPNANYRLFGANGFFTLSGALHQRLLEEIARRRSDA